MDHNLYACFAWISSFEAQINSVQKKIPLVVGFGITGKSLINHLSKSHKELYLIEDSADNFDFGKSLNDKLNLIVNPVIDEKLFNKVSEIYSSPGIPEDHIVLRMANENKINVLSDIEIFLKKTQCVKILVTGTNGKTSTCLILKTLLQSLFPNLNIEALGNIGFPVLDYMEKNLDIAIIEISSFQLKLIKEIEYDFGILLNIAEDHLDRHANFEEYKELKYSVLKNAVYGVSFESKNPFKNDHRNFKDKQLSSDILEMPCFRYWPSHDLENLKAALEVVSIYCEKYSDFSFLEVELKSFLEKAFSDFNRPSHRFELLEKINGINFINDSKATNLSSMLMAINATSSISKEGNIYLVCGGDLKNQNLTTIDLDPLRKVNKAIIYGKDKHKMSQSFACYTDSLTADDLIQATKLAIEHSSCEDYVLLSPACSSLDMFKDYAERGDIFKKYVRTLKSNES